MAVSYQEVLQSLKFKFIPYVDIETMEEKMYKRTTRNSTKQRVYARRAQSPIMNDVGGTFLYE